MMLQLFPCCVYGSLRKSQRRVHMFWIEAILFLELNFSCFILNSIIILQENLAGNGEKDKDYSPVKIYIKS